MGELIVHHVNAVCDVHKASAIRRLPSVQASSTAHLSRNCDGDKESGRASARNVTDKSGVARQMHYTLRRHHQTSPVRRMDGGTPSSMFILSGNAPCS